MIKILAWGDTHIQPLAPYATPVESGLTTHLMEILGWFQWLQSIITSMRPDIVVDLGDLFSSYGSVDVRALNVGVEGVETLQRACDLIEADYCFIIGNHDLYHGLLHNVPFFPGRTILSPKVVNTPEGPMGFVPYGRSIKEIEDQNPVVLFTHNDYVDIPYTTGRRPNEGDTVAVFKGKLIVNGHYHVPSQHDFGYSKFLNAGSVGARTFRDCGCSQPGMPIPHGAWLIEWNGDEITQTFIENPHTSYWLQIDGNDRNAAERLRDSELAPRINLRVDTNGPMYAASDVFNAESFKCFDVVLLPTVVAPLDGKTMTTSDAVVINPLEAALEYMDSVKAQGDFPELVDYDQTHKFVVDLVERVRAETPTRTEAVPLRLMEITLHNFYSLGEVSWKLHPGLSAVIGSNQDVPAKEDSRFENNGSGKTSMFEGIYWTITGKTIRGVSGSNVIREGEKLCTGTLSIQVGDHIYTIAREQRRTSKGAHTLKVYKDGVDITPRLQEGAHNVILELINLDDDLLMHLAFLMNGLQESMTRLKPLQRFQLIERLVGDLSIFDACAKAVNAAIGTAKTEQDERNGEIRSITDTRNRHNTELTDKQADFQQLSVNIDSRRQELVAQVAEANAGIEKGRTGVEQFGNNIAVYQEESNSIQQVIQQESSEKQRLLQEQATIYADIRNLTEQQQRHQNLIDAGKCPTCGAKTKTKNRTAEVEGLNAKLLEAKAKQQEVDPKLAEIDTNITERQKQQRERAAQAQEAQGNIEKWNTYIDTKQQEITAAEGEMQNLDHTVKQAQDRIGFLLSELEVLDEREDQAKVVIEELDKKLAMLRFLYHAPAKSGLFSPMGVRSHVIRGLLTFLNDRCAEYSQYLLPAGQKVLVTSMGATKADKPVSKIDLKVEGVKRPYASMSAGESRRIDIVLHLALRDLAQASSRFNMNLLVLDEVLDPLDDAGVRDVLRLLDTLGGDTSVWVVTQNDRLRGEMESGILVIKSDGISKVYPIEG